MDRNNLDKVMTLASSWLSMLVSIYVLGRHGRSGGRAHFAAEWEDGESLVYVNHGLRGRPPGCRPPGKRAVAHVAAAGAMVLGVLAATSGLLPWVWSGRGRAAGAAYGAPGMARRRLTVRTTLGGTRQAPDADVLHEGGIYLSSMGSFWRGR